MSFYFFIFSKYVLNIPSGVSMTKGVSFPQAFLMLKEGKAIRKKGWTDKFIIYVEEKKIFLGTAEHQLAKQYLDCLDGYEKYITQPPRFQLIYTPMDCKTYCSDGIVGPHLIDDYGISASDMNYLEWIVCESI